MSRKFAWTLWDMQNVSPSAEQAAQMGAAIKKAVEKRAPQATFKGRVYYSPSQAQAVSRIDGWKNSECEGDCDQKVINDARSLAGQNPRAAVIFLVAKDRDYTAVLKDLKAKSAQVYLIAPREGASRQLKDAVGKANVIALP